MKNAYSLDALALFTQNEAQHLETLGLKSKNEGSPKEMSLQKILGFSKSISVRKSKHHGIIEHHLN